MINTSFMKSIQIKPNYNLIIENVILFLNVKFSIHLGFMDVLVTVVN